MLNKFKIGQRYETRCGHQVEYIGNNMFAYVSDPDIIYVTDDKGNAPVKWRDIVGEYVIDPIWAKECNKRGMTL